MEMRPNDRAQIERAREVAKSDGNETMVAKLDKILKDNPKPAKS